MNVELNIQHYRMELKWSDGSHSPVGTWRVSVFPTATGGRWSGYWLAVEEAVANCLRENGLPVIEADSAQRR